MSMSLSNLQIMTGHRGEDVSPNVLLHVNELSIWSYEGAKQLNAIWSELNND